MQAKVEQPVIFGGFFAGVIVVCLLMGKTISVVPFIPLIAVVSVFLFGFAFVSTNAAMVLLIVAMLLSPEFAVGAFNKQREVVIRIDDLLTVVFILAWLARTAINRNLRFITQTPINKTIAFYCVAFILPTVKSMITGDVSPIKGSFYLFKYIEYFAIFYLACGVLKSKAQLINYLKIFLIVFAVVNIYAALQIGHTDRVSAPFEGTGEPNTLGGYQVLLLSVLIGLVTHANLGVWGWPLVAMALFTLIPFAHTLSRSSYMAIIPMYLTHIVYNRMITKTLLIGLMIIAVILLIFFFPATIKTRIQDAFTPEVQEGIPTAEIMGVRLGPSPSARINDWVNLINDWKRKPFFGYGLTGVGFVDSQFVMVLVETGLVGLTAFILLIGNVFIQTLHIYRRTADPIFKGLALGFLAAHVGLIVHALSANTFILIRIIEPYWFLAAMVMMIPKIDPAFAAVQPARRNPGSYIRNTVFFLQNRNSRI